MTVAQLLRNHLAQSREPQAAFARRIGLTPQTVSQLVRGDIKVPTADVRRKLAGALGIRHLDVLVAAGELAPDEVEPLPLSHIHDHRLAEIVAAWPRMTPELRTAISTSVRSLLAVPGLLDAHVEEPIIAVAR